MTTDDAPTERDVSTPEPNERIHSEWSEPTQPSTALIEAVAATTEREPVNLPPLYEYVEADALDTLLTSQSAKTNRTVTVTFAYDGLHVSITSSGRIELQLDATARE